MAVKTATSKIAPETSFIKSGVPGLDDLFVEKGIRKKNTVLVTGAPGTGKSILLWQFLYNGAMQGEPGLLLTIEEPAERVRENAKSLGIDFTELEKTKQIKIIERPLLTKSLFGAGELIENIKKMKAKRVAVDSLTMFKHLYPPETTEYRTELLKFMEYMKNEGVTMLCSSEREVTDWDNFAYEAQDFLFDGLVVVGKIRKGLNYERILNIAKMRGQDHSLLIAPTKIEKGGMHVYSKSPSFAMIDKDLRGGKKN
ncbi:MAG: ATPase domain-containing protein [archaeon]